MGKSVKPSYERRRRYRTCDRPPARQARRNGCFTDARDGRRIGRDLPFPRKNLRRVARQASEWTPPEAGKFAFARGTECLHPPFVALGGFARLAAGSCASLAHLLPQGMSAGRNLITLFSGVNNLSRSFLATFRRCPRAMRRTRRASPRRTRIAHACAHPTHRLHASIGAACSNSTTCSHDASRRPTTHRRCARTTRGAVVQSFDAGSRISRRTSAFARKLRELFGAHSPSPCAPQPSRAMKNPRRFRRGFQVLRRMGKRQCSSLSSSSA